MGMAICDTETTTFTQDELATILHGLRLVQEQLTPDWERLGGTTGSCRMGQCEHFNDDQGLERWEIDNLCERLNLQCRETI